MEQMLLNGPLSSGVPSFKASSSTTGEQLREALSGDDVMHVVDLSGCQQFSDGDLDSVASRCPGLLELDISGWQAVHVKSITQILKSCSNLAVLRLRNTSCTETAKWERGPTLVRILDLSGATQSTIDSISSIAAGFGAVACLGLGDCVDVSNETILGLIRCLPHLEEVSFENCTQIDNSTLIQIGSVLPNLKRVDLSGLASVTQQGLMTFTAGSQNLRSVNLNLCDQFDDDVVQTVFRMLDSAKQPANEKIVPPSQPSVSSHSGLSQDSAVASTSTTSACSTAKEEDGSASSTTTVEVDRELIYGKSGSEFPLNKALEQAVIYDSLKDFQNLVKRGADLDRLSSEGGETLLHLAARKGSAAIVRYLCCHRPGWVRTPSKNGYTPLMSSVHGRNTEIIALLVETGAEVNAEEGKGKQIALHLAASKGFENVVNCLLDHNSNMNAFSESITTPICLAARNGHLGVVKILAERGASLKAMGGKVSPAVEAVRKNRFHVLEYLLGRGVDPYLGNKGRAGSTLLTEAAFNGATECLEILLKRGMSPDALNSLCFSPLHVAAFNNHPSCVAVLIKHDADVMIRVGRGDDSHEHRRVVDYTPLHLAAEIGSVPCARMLLSAGADVNAVGGYRQHIFKWVTEYPETFWGGTPLHRAAACGHVNVVRFLLENGADPRIRNRFLGTTSYEPQKGDMPIALARFSSRKKPGGSWDECIALLKKAGGDDSCVIQ